MEVDIDLSALEIQENKRNHDEIESPNTSQELSDEVDEADHLRRSGRKRIRPLENIEKRRVFTRPRKLNVNSTMKDIENYYLDKKVKLSAPALETIFEEPRKGILMGARKLRRSVNFVEIYEKPDKNKVKKRVMKAKKINKIKKIGKKIGLEFVIKKLEEIEDE